MKRMMIIAIMLLFGISIVIAINTQEKNKMECTHTCEDTFHTTYETCKEAYDAGKDTCKTAFKTCMNDTKNYKEECKNVKDNRTEYRECMNISKEQNKACVKQNKECYKTVRDTFLGCLREGRTTWDACKLNCKETFMGEKECEKQGGTWNEEGNNCEYTPCETAQDCSEHGRKYNCVNKQCVKGK